MVRTTNFRTNTQQCSIKAELLKHS